MSNTSRTDEELTLWGYVRRDFARKLERELAECRADAERYRWLRQTTGAIVGGVWHGGIILDEEIDAARKVEK